MCVRRLSSIQIPDTPLFQYAKIVAGPGLAVKDVPGVYNTRMQTTRVDCTRPPPIRKILSPSKKSNIKAAPSRCIRYEKRIRGPDAVRRVEGLGLQSCRSDLQ